MGIVVERDEYSGPFFDGCAQGELLLRQCPRCGSFAAPAVEWCERCGVSLVWAPARGEGRLVTWSVGNETSATRTTNVAGIVELDEGPWIHARIVVGSVDELRLGLSLRAEFGRPNDDGAGELVPIFIAASECHD